MKTHQSTKIYYRHVHLASKFLEVHLEIDFNPLKQHLRQSLKDLLKKLSRLTYHHVKNHRKSSYYNKKSKMGFNLFKKWSFKNHHFNNSLKILYSKLKFKTRSSSVVN